jgi:hypothetical protein
MRLQPRRRHVRMQRGLIVVAFVTLGLAVAPLHGAAQARPTQPLVYSGSAAADGISLLLTVPGAPLVDAPVDLSGPSAQVAGDSLGTSTGYAAFPDPGPLVVSAPGLVVGLLGQGAAGLPPINLPSLPNYPLIVTSDAGTTPTTSLGQPPVELNAESHPGVSKASGKVGFETGVTGSAVVASSVARLTTSDTGATTTAVADVQGIGVGPLTIGEIKSTATMGLDANGILTPSSTLEISGLKVGGIPIAVAPQGLIVGSQTIPLALGPVFNSLLKAAGVTVEVQGAHRFPDRVIAPALKVTFPFAMPFAVPNLGKISGNASVTLGSATAQLNGVLPATRVTDSTPTVTDNRVTAAPTSGDGLPVASGSGAVIPPAAAAPDPVASRAPEATTVGAETLIGLDIDLRPVFLMIAAASLVALALGQLISRLGGRAWSS